MAAAFLLAHGANTNEHDIKIAGGGGGGGGETVAFADAAAVIVQALGLGAAATADPSVADDTNRGKGVGKDEGPSPVPSANSQKGITAPAADHSIPLSTPVSNKQDDDVADTTPASAEGDGEGAVGDYTRLCEILDRRLRGSQRRQQDKGQGPPQKDKGQTRKVRPRPSTTTSVGFSQRLPEASSAPPSGSRVLRARRVTRVDTVDRHGRGIDVEVDIAKLDEKLVQYRHPLKGGDSRGGGRKQLSHRGVGVEDGYAPALADLLLDVAELSPRPLSTRPSPVPGTNPGQTVGGGKGPPAEAKPVTIQSNHLHLLAILYTNPKILYPPSQTCNS